MTEYFKRLAETNSAVSLDILLYKKIEFSKKRQGILVKQVRNSNKVGVNSCIPVSWGICGYGIDICIGE